MFHGQGKLSTHDTTFDGCWRDGMRHGEGRCTFADGAAYAGSWSGDRAHGHGRLKARYSSPRSLPPSPVQPTRSSCLPAAPLAQYASGDLYDGEWREGKKHGKGRFSFASGSTYEGEWRDDRRHGEGMLSYSDGDRYQGGWREDKKHGTGVCTFSDGVVYNGGWHAGSFHGAGTLSYRDGRVFEGLWEARWAKSDWVELGGTAVLHRSKLARISE